MPARNFDIPRMQRSLELEAALMNGTLDIPEISDEPVPVAESELELLAALITQCNSISPTPEAMPGVDVDFLAKLSDEYVSSGTL